MCYNLPYAFLALPKYSHGSLNFIIYRGKYISCLAEATLMIKNVYNYLMNISILIIAINNYVVIISYFPNHSNITYISFL